MNRRVEMNVDMVCAAAADAFASAPLIGPLWSGALLEAIARRLEDDRMAIVEIADDESHLGATRLHGELTRTTFQLRQFAVLSETTYGNVDVHDAADVDAVPAPSPDLTRVLVPVGPVAVFAASNFPLAFGVVGGDTAAALAAGCPVVARAHPLQIATAQRLAGNVREALDEVGAPPGWFGLVDDPSRTVGTALVAHPAIEAVGFTGSFDGGMALAATAARRERPIPVYAEMGSINPLFVTELAARAKGADVASGLAASISLGVGQFCTKPGLVVLPQSPAGEQLVDGLVEHLRHVPPAPMLSEPMAQSFRSGFRERAAMAGVTALVDLAVVDGPLQSPALLRVEPAALADGHPCLTELFGPAAVVTATNDPERIARMVPGSLTATVHTADGDHEQRTRLLRVLARRVGRIVHNGYPTGVAVKPAMHHGGPYPSSNHSGATSVGLRARDRFQRPVTLQSWPDSLIADMSSPDE